MGAGELDLVQAVWGALLPLVQQNGGRGSASGRDLVQAVHGAPLPLVQQNGGRAVRPGRRSSWSRASSPSRSFSNSRTRDNKSSLFLRLQGPLDDIPIIQLPLDSILQYPSVLKNFNM